MFVFGSPVVVRADSSFTPYINTGNISFEYDYNGTNCTLNSSCYGIYHIYNGNANYSELYILLFDIKPLNFSLVQNGSVLNSFRSGSFTYSSDTTYTCYYQSYYCVFDPNNYSPSCSGCYTDTLIGLNRNEQNLVRFFLFGVGDYDYDLPAQDIQDSDLDIKGLSAFILNDFQATPDYIETAKNAWKEFYVWSMNKLTGQIFDDSFVPIDLQDPISGTTKYFVPGVAMSWISPTLDNDIIYNIWVDGISDIKYKTSSNIIDNFFNTQRLDTISYGKLKINDSSLLQNPSVYYQYNTAQAVDVILDYIKNNALVTSPVQIDPFNYISLDTKISRVYIQASKVIDGDNHVGALSYIDIVGGVPVVHDGITSIDDVVASDPTTGTPAIVGSTSVVSGDTIYGGDTYFDNSTTNFITTGLVVGNGDPLSALTAVKRLFSAIFELVQALYLTKLLKWLLVGFTGNPLGDLIL